MLSGINGIKRRCGRDGGTGQIIATSHDLGPQKVAFWKGNPLISGKSRLVKYIIIWPDGLVLLKIYLGNSFQTAGWSPQMVVWEGDPPKIPIENSNLPRYIRYILFIS